MRNTDKAADEGFFWCESTDDPEEAKQLGVDALNEGELQATRILRVEYPDPIVGTTVEYQLWGRDW